MKTNYKHNIIKKDYNVNYSTKIYPHTNINYEDLNQEENVDTTSEIQTEENAGV